MIDVRRALALAIWGLLLVTLLDARAGAQSQSAAASNRFDRTVAPILSEHCLSCHHGKESKGGLDLSRRESAMRGGQSGVAIVPNNIDESHLWDLVEAGDMPPEYRLSAEEQTVIRQWIAEGANWGTDPIDPFAFSSSRRAGHDWWSLQPLRRPPLPSTEDDQWCVNEIDHFVLARLNSNQLASSPPADARTLVRRLYVDLLGLPAPVEAIEAFAAAPSPAAWQNLVDDLLASRHYGERWARHWMDVARFGESDGFEYNAPRESSWHYRDWLINAFNADMPFDEFTRMQLAGDLLQPDTLDGAAAVGFLVAGPHNTVAGVSPIMKLAVRHDELEELAGTVGQTFLGMTINCARCHDHKFDPITAHEYYSFIAALDGVRHGQRSVPSPSKTDQRQRIVAQQDLAEEQLVEHILSRRGTTSKTANMLVTKKPLAANMKGRTYRVSFKIAPSVWAAANQATSDRDGVAIRILKQDGSTLAAHLARPGGWQAGEDAIAYQPKSFDYVGDGDRGVRIHLRPFPLNSDRFGGALDDIRVLDVAAGETVFSEDFDGLQQHNKPGNQADTGCRVFSGATSEHWNHSGTNTIHSVEYADGNLALQLFGGNGGTEAIVAETAAEQERLDELASLANQLARIPSPFVYSVIASDPGVMHLYERGDVSRPGQAVTAGGIAAIRNVPNSFAIDKAAPDSQRRIQLANWITHPENSLFHRVIVNRIWHYHFGQGLVTSPSDFGFNGGQPSHPMLLDWLSVWFRNNGYSLKKLHRLIVTSSTYQQASRSRPVAAMIDNSNRLLWRQNPRRIEAEVLRDSILEIAGQLNPNAFGPGYRDVQVVQVPPAFYYSPMDPSGNEFNRRTIYRWHVRGQRSALLDTFDCPDPSSKTPTRMVTTTPSQALSQWNDGFITRMSEHLADRIQTQSVDDVEQQVTAAWRHVLGRLPSAPEHEQAVRLVRDHGLPLLCRVLFNSNEFILID